MLFSTMCSEKKSRSTPRVIS